MVRRIIVMLLLSAGAWPAWSASVTVDELRGDVTAATYGQFEKFVGDHLDRVIGLKVAVEASNGRGLAASADGGQLVIYRTSNTQSEIVVPSGFSFQHASFVFDGFFLVKSGGMHQGMVSFGLQPVNEAAVRLNPSIRIRSLSLGR